MGLRKSTGNMYDWVDAHWNPIKGECQHRCDYCYVDHSRAKRFYEGPCRLDEKDLETKLSIGQRPFPKTIFVGSMGDMWGEWVPDKFIERVIAVCLKYPANQYIFQSKNPARFRQYKPQVNFLYGTTLETDEYPKGFNTNGPITARSINARVAPFKNFSPLRRIFITIEPIMDFNLFEFVEMIRKLHPEFVTIGADSKHHNLIEPSWQKVQALIETLGNLDIEIRQKTNLERLRK